MPVRDRDERGQSFSVLVVAVMIALLLVAGLVVDGGAQSNAARRAETAASEAARAALDSGAPARAAGRSPNPGLMEAAGRHVLSARGVDGTVTVVAGRIRVETSLTTRTVFLSLVGINTLRAVGSAEAELRAP